MLAVDSFRTPIMEVNSIGIFATLFTFEENLYHIGPLEGQLAKAFR